MNGATTTPAQVELVHWNDRDGKVLTGTAGVAELNRRIAGIDSDRLIDIADDIASAYGMPLADWGADRFGWDDRWTEGHPFEVSSKIRELLADLAEIAIGDCDTGALFDIAGTTVLAVDLNTSDNGNAVDVLIEAGVLTFAGVRAAQ